jgi:malto-oligosyltrehalose synthase
VTAPRLGSTYRVQLHGLGLVGVTELVPYLASLGIETLYVSPVLAAAPGSSHGYDVVDPGRLDPALGSEHDLRTLLETCETHGLRVLIDIVPNHMSTDAANAWWRDVLGAGPASPHASTFDIDWSRHGGRVLLPVLDRPLRAVLEDDDVRVDPRHGALELGAARLPLAPGTASGAAAAVLGRQHYRPAYWRSAATMGNYRRFFDVNGLVGVRVEDPAVFDRTHELVIRLCADPRVAGLRVDHVDGLSDPAAYLERLRSRLDEGGPRVVVVEKIVRRGESLSPPLAADGTTGYEFGDVAGGLFVEGTGAVHLAAAGAAFTGEHRSFTRLAREAKAEVLEQSFPGELAHVARLALAALDATAPGHDLSGRDVRRALAALTVRLDVYRTYLGAALASSAERARLEETAVGAAHDERLGDEERRALSLVTEGMAHAAGQSDPWLTTARRWQQLTGAVMAKGVEDTATYRYPGLLAQAEVGADPDSAASSVDDFHRFASRRRSGLNATSTHDSKRNEDARARLSVLAEEAATWERLVSRWHRRFAAARAPLPHPGEEWAIYQALLALWPPDRDHMDRGTLGRVQAYAEKAAREAKRRTSWIDPDLRYERTLRGHLARVAADAAFRGEMSRFVRRIAPAAVTNSLSLLVLKCCTPGTPDLYQGTEFFDPTLTDPDNRRPVDFAARRHALEALPAATPAAASRLLRRWHDGAVKLFVIRALLHERRARAQLFDGGDYRPLHSSSDHVVAFARHNGRDRLLCIVPRLVMTLAGPGRFPLGPVWEGMTVAVPRWAAGTYTDIFTGMMLDAAPGALGLDELLGSLPVAVLRRTGPRRATR